MLISLMSGFGLNLLIALLIVRFMFYPAKQDKNYVFTFLAFSTLTYFVVGFLMSAEIGVGVGFGMFAVFSILRYRTITMSPREMTYLFVVIALAVMNSMMTREIQWEIFLATNAAVMVVLFVLEQEWGFHYESTKLIKYDRIELIKPESHDALLEDLRQRTGLAIKRIELGSINFLNDTAELKVYYEEPKSARRSLAYGMNETIG